MSSARINERAARVIVATDEITKDYAAARRGVAVRAVDGVSIQIRAGETFGLVGESGSGKSTLGRLLLRLEAPTAGDIFFDGESVAGITGREGIRRFRRRVQIVQQDPYAALNPRKTVGQSIALPLEVQKLEHGRARSVRIGQLLEMVGLDRSHATAYPHELSGGQLQRVGIARALAPRPEFVVLDEAVSALDVSIRAQILNLLRDLQTELQLTYLFISHDLAIVRYMAANIAVMYRGRVVEIGSRDDLFERPGHPYTRSLLAAIPGSSLAAPVPAADVPSDADDEGVNAGCPYRPLCDVGRDRPRCAGERPVLEDLSPAHGAACFFPSHRAEHVHVTPELGAQ